MDSHTPRYLGLHKPTGIKVAIKMTKYDLPAPSCVACRTICHAWTVSIFSNTFTYDPFCDENPVPN